MGKRIRIGFLLLLLFAVSCVQEDAPKRNSIAEGTPVTLTIGFNATTPVDVRVSTKAEATRADESRVHDLYVLIFDSGGEKKYGRYFNYQHKWNDTAPLVSHENENEGWYVRNKTLDGTVDPETGVAVEKTIGAVKIATAALSDCTLVLLANVDNTLISLGGEDPLDALNSVTSYNELKNLPVRLEQDVVVRKDLFLMLGEIPNLDMTAMTWDKTSGDATGDFGTDYRVTLSPIDAKVKFRIKVNSSNISEFTPHKWFVSNLPSSCYLYGRTPYAFPSEGAHYFDTEPIYFESEEKDANEVTWQTFTFYMLESCLAPETTTPNYSARELQNKNAAPVTYTDETGTHTIQYVSNGTETDNEWVYAPANSPFVTFSASITLKDGGIEGLAGWNPQTNPQPAGVTGEMSYTIHLGNFSHTGDDPNDADYNTPNPSDYNTIRGHFYTYDITINNAANLYAEVKSFHPDDPNYAGLEDQPGQEGSLLLNSGGIVNCDAHYEYRSIEFAYNSTLAGQLSSNPDYHVFSWFVKTPFTEAGRPEWDNSLHRYVTDSTQVDFLWVKFAINELESGTNPKQSTYSERRTPYPGNSAYKYNWFPGADLDDDGDTEDDIPGLFDINQLINYIYYQYRRKNAYDADNSKPADIFDSGNTIRATAFVNEYYYEWDPFTGLVDPNLWRTFVNADPREMHILSDVQSSRDRMSNLISSSHSIIQRSIQTIYNVNSAELKSIWGTEHKDEIRETKDESSQAWTGWPWGVSSDATINTYTKSEENGRLNSAALWGLYPSPDSDHDQWEDFLEYAVINSVPELKDADHRKMAYSCLTRNRDNDGDGDIDPEEVRWYMASINQLKGMWVGNESLSTTARVYQPWGTDWRAHVISSTCPSNASTPKVLNAEEGVATFDYALKHSWAGNNEAEERLRESVRCVRNVGTYTVGSKQYDISSAPYSETPDPYYTVEETKDPNHSNDLNYSTYTIQFRRLDPRSLREYTDKELPFHDEKSSNNRVYLELHIQSRASRLTETPDYADVGTVFGGESAAIDMGIINETITNDGNNKFCPAGYRLPNQRELAMMTLVLPSTYWNNATRLPSRTYFSHGLYAASGQQKTGEENKLGFAYTSSNNNIFLPDRGQATNRIRCVRDNELTGIITGEMHLSSTRIMPGEQTTLSFNFSSAGATFESGTARLYLCYTDQSGNPVETEIALDKQPSGLSYRESQTFTAPALASLDPQPGTLPVPMQLKLVLSNVRENSQQTFYTSFTLVDLNIFCDFEILPGHDDTQGFPINVTAETSGDAQVSTLKLYWRTDNGNWAELQDLSTLASGKTEYERTVYFNNPVAAGHVYSFKVVATSDTPQTYTSGMKSMEIVRLNYSPNVTGVYYDGGWHDWGDDWWNEIKDGETDPNAYLWHNSLVGNVATEYVDKEQMSVICNPWTGHKVDNLDFSRGDFIEADMDLINCVFIRTVSGDLTKNPMKNQIIGLDNIFSIGKDSIAWGQIVSDELHFYYPAHVDPSDDQLQIDPVYLNKNNYSRLKFGGIDVTNGKRQLFLCFDRDGVKYNGTTVVTRDEYYTNVISDLTACHSLYIGAQEGSHLSRATYNYVRVVRNDLSSVSDNVTGGFDHDPINGGKL